MATPPEGSSGASEAMSPIEPLIDLLIAILLLSTVPTVTKYVFQHSTLAPLEMALIRVMIGFCFLLVMTLAQHRTELNALTAGDVCRLTLLGALGVGSYVIAAWGLQLTSVTHYILIYSLLSPFTALFSVLLGKSRNCAHMLIGIVISLAGGGIALSKTLEHAQADFGLGDLLILSFTVMMAAHLVWSANIVKRFGAMTANTVMFGSSALALSLAGVIWVPAAVGDFSMSIVFSVLYIGVATASVFLLRYRVLHTISPSTVAVYQNLTPVCALVFAHVYLGEPITFNTILGGALILLGAELVRRAHLPKRPTRVPLREWAWGEAVSEKPSR